MSSAHGEQQRTDPEPHLWYIAEAYDVPGQRARFAVMSSSAAASAAWLGGFEDGSMISTVG